MTTNLERWYSTVRIPFVFGLEAQSFAANISGFITSVVNAEGSKAIRVCWSKDIDVACADRGMNTIVINERFLLPNGDEFRRTLNPAGMTVQQTIASVIGIVIHEALHFRLSPNVLNDLVPAHLADNRLAGTIGNISEDMYIEHYGVKTFKHVAWSISDLWELVYGPHLYNERIAKWDGSKPTTIEEVYAAVNVATAWKNQNVFFTHRTDFEEQLYEMFYSVFEMHSLSERIVLNEKIYNFLMEGVVKEEQEGGQGSGEGEVNGDPMAHKGGEDIQRVLANSVASRFEDHLENTPITGLEEGDGYTVHFRKVVGGEESPMRDLPEWRKIGEVAESHATARRVSGRAKRSGKRIGRPENAIDKNSVSYGKIFNDAKLDSEYGAGVGLPQILLLVDLSGSMSGDKLTDSLDVAYNAVKGLGKHGVPCAVYGYTTDYGIDGDEQPFIFALKGWEDNYAKGALAISRANKTVRLGMTPTDAAIKWAKDSFPGKHGTKVMVVITDGDTAWRCASSGNEGTRKTVEAVKSARKAGVQVFSVSVDNSAMRFNDKIYGIASNTMSNDAKAAAKIVASIVG